MYKFSLFPVKIAKETLAFYQYQQRRKGVNMMKKIRKVKEIFILSNKASIK